MINFFFISFYPNVYIIEQSMLKKVDGDLYYYSIDKNFLIIFLKVKNTCGMFVYAISIKDSYYYSDAFFKGVYSQPIRNVPYNSNVKCIGENEYHTWKYANLIVEKLESIKTYKLSNVGIKIYGEICDIGSLHNYSETIRYINSLYS